MARADLRQTGEVGLLSALLRTRVGHGQTDIELMFTTLRGDGSLDIHIIEQTNIAVYTEF